MAKKAKAKKVVAKKSVAKKVVKKVVSKSTTRRKLVQERATPKKAFRLVVELNNEKYTVQTDHIAESLLKMREDAGFIKTVVKIKVTSNKTKKTVGRIFFAPRGRLLFRKLLNAELLEKDLKTLLGLRD